MLLVLGRSQHIAFMFPLINEVVERHHNSSPIFVRLKKSFKASRVRLVLGILQTDDGF